MNKLLRISLLSIFILSVFASYNCLNAQASLSIQGILKKSNGLAVDDGTYAITFKLYESETGPTAIWTETQNEVEVFNGIYSAILGQSTALTVPFDTLYYLGVKIGATELSPRILLTSAPYALSLIGINNQFPSSGEITADDAKINGGVKVKTGGPIGNGYAFDGEEDSGMFSKANGWVSLYSNNVESIVATPVNVVVNTNLDVGGTLNTNDINLINNSNITYNGQKDWRLVDTDYFHGGSNGNEGWKVYDKISGGYTMGWNRPSSTTGAPTKNMGDFIGFVLYPDNNDHVLKKLFTPPGTFTQIKVKFRYYFLDSWGWGGGDRSWAAFSDDEQGSSVKVGWMELGYHLDHFNGDFESGGTPFVQNANFDGDQDYADYWSDVEMTANANGPSFWLFIGAAVDMAVDDESFAVGAVEIYVK